MFGYLLLLFTLIPALELYVLIKVGSVIGAGNTLIVIVLTGVIGAYLARLQGFLALRRIQENLSKGVVPSEELLDGFMILLGGIVLLTPGFITDAMGLVFLIPWTRSAIKWFISKKIAQAVKEGRVHIATPQPPPRKDDYTDIDI